MMVFFILKGPADFLEKFLKTRPVVDLVRIMHILLNTGGVELPREKSLLACCVMAYKDK